MGWLWLVSDAKLKTRAMNVYDHERSFAVLFAVFRGLNPKLCLLKNVVQKQPVFAVYYRVICGTRDRSHATEDEVDFQTFLVENGCNRCRRAGAFIWPIRHCHPSSQPKVSRASPKSSKVGKCYKQFFLQKQGETKMCYCISLFFHCTIIG